VVRALYVNRFAAQSSKRMKQMIQIADETEINALVIDLKDEFGLNYSPSNPEYAKNAGTSGTIKGLPALLDTLRAHHILPIARMVVFKDSVTARVHPEWTIRKQDGSVWRDKKSLAWVNPYHHELWDYNIGVAEELVKMGFSEIQFDYIRFPEPYASLPTQVFPDSKGMSKPDVLAAYLKEANGRLDKLGARTTADVFGLVTTVGGPLEDLTERRRRAADGVSVALSARRSGIGRSERRAVQGSEDLVEQGEGAGSEARHQDAGACAAVAAGVHARQAGIWAGRDRGAEEGGVRRGLRRVGALESWLEVRAVPSGAREDAGNAQEALRVWCQPRRLERISAIAP
jgi:hypothetical protein